MRLILQPPNSNKCGQTSLAMLMDCTVDEACALVGKTGKTRSRDLIPVLRSKGFTTGDRCVRFRGFDALPDVAVLHAVHPCWRHWMVWNEASVWDPAGKPSEFFTGCKQSVIRVTSYFAVSFPPGHPFAPAPRPPES